MVPKTWPWYATSPSIWSAKSLTSDRSSAAESAPPGTRNTCWKSSARCGRNLVNLDSLPCLQSKETVTGMTAAENREVIASKALQLSSLFAYQLLSAPREVAALDKRAEVAVVAIRTLLVFLVPAAGLWRSQLNFKLQQPHDVIS